MAKRKGKAARRRNVRNFKEIPPEERRNSKSIRRLLFDMIDQKYGRSVNSASSSFSKSLRNARDRRGYHRGMTAESLYRTSLDDYFFTYSQLDAMAQVYGVPLSAVFLFTRIRSELDSIERRKSSEAERIITAFREALDHLYELTLTASKSDGDIYAILDHQAFEDFISVYRDKFNESLF